MTTSADRLHGLDALRATALGLGIVLHSLLPFAPGGSWLVTDSQTTAAVDVPLTTIHLFRMTLFMLLAGYFGQMVVQRRGSRSYLRDRCLRILLPLVAFWPVAVLSLGLLIGLHTWWRGLPAPSAPPPPPGVPGILLLLNPGQLWFLAVLMQCVLLTLVMRAVLLRLLGPARAGAAATRVGGLLAGPPGVVLAAVPYLLSLLLQGQVDGGILQPVSVLPELPTLTGYLGAFLVGWLLRAAPDSLQRLARSWPVLLVAAVLLTAVVVWDLHRELPFALVAPVTALAGWTWTYGLVGLCTRNLHRDRPLVRYLADASYWAYLMHLPILVAVELVLAGLGWPILLKLLLTWAVTAALLLISYELGVRATWVGRWLNGHRRPRVWRPLTGSRSSAGTTTRAS